VNQLTSRHY